MAEFVLNSQMSSATDYTPFEIVYGYTPDFTIPAGKHSSISALDDRLDNMAQIRKEAEAALRQSKACMKEEYEATKKHAHLFKIGDMVWLSTKDIKVHQPSPKLGPCQLGPFKVLEQIGDLDYKLELPHWLKVHPVFHVNRLSPWHDQGVDQPLPPKPVEITGEEEYEVEDILDSKYAGRGIRYFVKWVGYGPEHNSWLSCTQLANSPDLIERFHRLYPNKPHKINSALLN